MNKTNRAVLCHTHSSPKLTTIPLNPVTAYLSRLSPSSRHTMRKLLNRIAQLFGANVPGEKFAWSKLRYADTLGLRQLLAANYAPAAAHLALAALRGVLRESWRLDWLGTKIFSVRSISPWYVEIVFDLARRSNQSRSRSC